MSIRDIGIPAALDKAGKYEVYDRDKAPDRAAATEIYLKAFSCDYYLSSANAITEDGELYNVDGNGNRVSAMIFGPKQVIIIAGVNKIVKNLEEAKRRVEKVTAPKNTVRLNCATPCAKTGECERLRSGSPCKSDARICCSYVTLGQQRVPDRIKVIIVNENLGY